MSEPYGELPRFPGPPEWPQRAAAPGPPPAAVQTAVRLMLVRSAIGVVSLIVLFATKDDFEKRVREKTPNATDSTVNTALTVAAGFATVVLVFYVFLAFRVRKGANWARIVTWVIAGLGILGALLSFGQPDPPLSRALGIVVGLLDVTVVILLASGESNRFFKPAGPLR